MSPVYCIFAQSGIGSGDEIAPQANAALDRTPIAPVQAENFAEQIF
ncbi:hypothetical protein [Hoeflea sp.]|nr:hypothetical protein [Hoeflea sp.]MBC7284411.1 hypothetical protein [Hoeflea sp.]